MVFTSERKAHIPTQDILSWIFDDVKYDQDKPIYVDTETPSRSISSRQARSIIRKLAAGFAAAGLQRGDCVCLNSFNDVSLYQAAFVGFPEALPQVSYSMLFLGIIAAGGIFSGTNPSYTPYELSHHLKVSKSRYVITEAALLPKVLEATDKLAIRRENVWIFDVRDITIPPGFKSWTELMNHGEADWQRFDDEKTARETTAARLFTSGTSGLPKAANLSHYNFVAQHTLVHEIDIKPYESSALLCLPMFHAACVPVAHTSPLRSGNVAYVMRRFELEPFLSNYQKYKITEMRIVPPIVIAIIMSPLSQKYSLRSVKIASCGAAPLGKAEQKKLHNLLAPGALFTQVWGMTETTCIATKFYYPEDDNTGSVGRLLPNIEAKIVDDEGKEVHDYGVRGEMCVRGPTIVQGYFDNAMANADSFDSDGFFHTGDIVFCDAKTKKWYVVDRKKELIKVRGFQVAPPELEAVLLSHSHIVDAAVIGVRHRGEPDLEHPRAYVVKRPGPKGLGLTPSSVKEFCSGKLAKYKELTGGVVFVDAIPKNASGKILKRVLRDQAKIELQQSASKL
ncbi:MAG: hypothetical protein M1818_006560 [Claussenomyces sp. TS43310]|nr:MAG: hypothetical protein M1818_006560 [Claussenomyces sp. TS43310]